MLDWNGLELSNSLNGIITFINQICTQIDPLQSAKPFQLCQAGDAILAERKASQVDELLESVQTIDAVDVSGYVGQTD